MQVFALTALVVYWFAWGYPFIFRAPHHQKRESVTVAPPSQVGLLLEGISIFMAFAFRLPAYAAPGWARVIPALILGAVAAIFAWTAVQHLGKQFRIQAGLYEDHELVRTGPYAIVRHPIYLSLLAILSSTLLILTPWRWALVSLAIFFVGTEIRVHAEDKLLASRFGEEFEAYRQKVPAYLPFVR
ncbi:MAG TPA: isoprenylcysteine carboxylmethyltransferase family protein [Bryobacteraceae bacterium]|nr:isoprenylcysteine carboxylmethyltransferase family protein [Bryobacteraceae bacterium]